ncbi:nucleotide-sugar transporter-domain-containing protein [Cristinia sonorae]|uniref:Nucleotide-sugar transporter-domain-containing protein n=1 Tax=Cristinia sonorae TaxID=1940300 RepID=A0A8K0UYD3_9AGAR|nr:nucleotide-sugar transporter-domain-containing protein [Cristinia sonorae]
MHYSRVSAPPSQTYSAAAAVLLTELLKGSVSLLVAFTRIDAPAQYPGLAPVSQWSPWALLVRTRRLLREVFRADAWKLSIPAILYVIQNNLQFVAVSNLDAATFQVSYQMKILTTAAFSVLLLRRKLSPTKWLALLFLAIGVGIVQIQGGSSPTTKSLHDMNAVKGFVAVVAACFTSGLAGVYFEMVLKNSQADLWVRNVQLSLFSLLPALAAILFAGPPAAVAGPLGWFNTSIFANFGVWAWATVLIQVLGGLLTALVIKYADNILKGFATSLSIVISFMVSVALFNFHMTLTFILGSTIVLVATWMYNQPDRAITMGLSDDRSWSWQWKTTHSRSVPVDLIGNALSRRASTTSLSSVSSFSTPVHSKSYPPSPIERSSPNLQFLDNGAHGKHSRFFSFAPAKAARFFVSRMGLTRSASFGGVGANANVPNADYGLPQFSFSSSTTSSHTPQPLLGSSLSSSGYTPIMSRPTSAMSSFSSAGPSSLSSSTLSESRISS